MLRETPVFIAMRANRNLVPELALRVVARIYSHGVAVSLLSTWILSAVVVMLTLMVPTILQGAHFYTRQEGLIATIVSSLFLSIGCVISGVSLDRIGAARLFIGGGSLLLLGDIVFYQVSSSDCEYLYLFSAIIGLSGAVVVGAPVVMVSSFPSFVRFTGVSFSYNVAYAILGGLTPVSVAALLSLNAMSHIYYLAFVGLLSVGLGIYLRVCPEATRYRPKEPR